MKKIFLIVTILCSLLVCGICSAAPARQQVLAIDTKFCMMILPSSWRGECGYRIRDHAEYGYTIELISMSSRIKGKNGAYGGEFFELQFVRPDYEDYGMYFNCVHLGNVTVKGSSYNVIAVYPNYPQYAPKAEAKFKSMQKQMPAVLKNLRYKKGVVHSPKTLPVDYDNLLLGPEGDIDSSYESE